LQIQSKLVTESISTELYNKCHLLLQNNSALLASFAALLAPHS